MTSGEARPTVASGTVSRWWVPWLGLLVLVGTGLAIPSVVPSVRRVREQMQAQRCREQMRALAAGEFQHYLDHRAFTTVQQSLTRYIPYAERARCPSCRAPYRLHVLKDHVTIECPCEGTRHGKVEQDAPHDSIWPAAPVPRMASPAAVPPVGGDGQ